MARTTGQPVLALRIASARPISSLACAKSISSICWLLYLLLNRFTNAGHQLHFWQQIVVLAQGVAGVIGVECFHVHDLIDQVVTGHEATAYRFRRVPGCLKRINSPSSTIA